MDSVLLGTQLASRDLALPVELNGSCRSATHANGRNRRPYTAAFWLPALRGSSAGAVPPADRTDQLIARILAHRRARGQEEAPVASLGPRAPPPGMSGMLF
jgi:hypothetical protein